MQITSLISRADVILPALVFLLVSTEKQQQQQKKEEKKRKVDFACLKMDCFGCQLWDWDDERTRHVIWADRSSSDTSPRDPSKLRAARARRWHRLRFSLFGRSKFLGINLSSRFPFLGSQLSIIPCADVTSVFTVFPPNNPA